MTQIVAFAAKDVAQGEEALEQLEGKVIDAAVIYKTDRGRVKIRQTSDMTAGKGLVRGGLLGAVASIFAGPLVGVTVAGGALGTAYGALRDKGVSDKLMKAAGRHLDRGHAAVFVLADDATAKVIVDEVTAAGGDDVEVGAFPVEAQNLVREALKVA
jgi:uncharacterized membrane protein